MKNFDAIFHVAFLGIYIYHIFYFLSQFRLLKRIELFYFSMFLLSVVIYFFGFVTPVVFSFYFNHNVKTIFSAFEMSFAFIQNYLYFSFVQAYLSLTKTDQPVFKWLIFFKKINLFNLVIFLGLGILKIESRDFFSIVALLTLPFSIYILILLWKMDTLYSKVIILGTTFGLAATISAYICIIYETYSKQKLPFNNHVPYQLGLLFDLFVLGYGLSLKTAETDKKLVASLQENQKLVEVERSRLARDLHDGLGGLLSGVKLTLSSINGTSILPNKNAGIFTSAIHQLDHTIAEMRRVAHSMMPEALLKFGLNEAVQDFCDGINETNTVKMKYHQINFKEPLEKPTEVILYRIIQELSNNAIKHAAPKIIFIQITKHLQGISLVVEDDGKGFDITQTKKGDGLQNVQSRIDYLKGNWDIKSEKDNGTSVNIEIPL